MWESDGRFAVSYYRQGDFDDLGCGNTQTVTVFHSAEGRHYFIEMLKAQRRERLALRDLEWLKVAIARTVTPKGRVRRKQVLAMARQFSPPA